MTIIRTTIDLNEDEFISTVQTYHNQCKCNLTDELIDQLPILAESYRIYDTLVSDLSVQVHKDGYVSYIKNSQNSALGRSDRDQDMSYNQIKQEYLDVINDDAEITVKHFIKKYFVPHISRLAMSTQKDYYAYIRRFIYQPLGNKKIKNLNFGDIKQLHDSLSDTPYQANRVLSMVSKIISIAKNYDIYEKENPCTRVKKCKEERRQHFLKQEELDELSDVMNELGTTTQNRMHNLMIYFLLQTGSRLSEMTGLKRSQIKKGKIYWDNTKTGKKVIPISPQIQELLDATKILNPSSKYVFYDKNHVSEHTFRDYWYEIRELVDIPQIRIHDLRHSFASICLENGKSLEYIRNILNHKSLSTTQRYLHATTESIVDVMESVGKRLKKLHIFNA